MMGSSPHSSHVEALRAFFNEACADWQLHNKYLADRPAWYHEGHAALDELVEQLETTHAEINTRTDSQANLLQKIRELQEQLEALERSLLDATRLIAALVYRTNKTSGVLLYPNDLKETLTLSRYDNPLAKTIHLFASNPATKVPHQGDYEPPEVDDWRPGDERPSYPAGERHV